MCFSVVLIAPVGGETTREMGREGIEFPRPIPSQLFLAFMSSKIVRTATYVQKFLNS